MPLEHLSAIISRWYPVTSFSRRLYPATDYAKRAIAFGHLSLPHLPAMASEPPAENHRLALCLRVTCPAVRKVLGLSCDRFHKGAFFTDLPFTD
jgi:hypothetical protein